MSPRPLETDPCGLEASHTLYKGRRMSGSVSRGPGRFLEGLVGFGNDIRSDFNVFWRAGHMMFVDILELFPTHKTNFPNILKPLLPVVFMILRHFSARNQ